MDDLNPLSTLVAAFVGSGFAFVLQNWHDARTRAIRQVVDGNRALTALYWQLNTLTMYKVDYIDPLRFEPDRHLRIEATLDFDENPMSVDIDSLYFLMGREHMAVLVRVIIAERRVNEAMRAINKRSGMSLTLIQPRLNEAGLRWDRKHPKERIIAAIGEMDYFVLEKLTTDIIEIVDSTLDDLTATHKHLRAALLSRHQGSWFSRFARQFRGPGKDKDGKVWYLEV